MKLTKRLARQAGLLYLLLIPFGLFGVLYVPSQLFWGIWLFSLGYLVYQSGFIPKSIGILLMVACFGYLIDSFIYCFNPRPPIVLIAFIFVGELAITLYLLVIGIKTKRNAV